MRKRKILGFNHLNKKLGLFDTNHNYNLSEKSIATKPYSFQLWAVSYIVDKATDRLNFKEIAFMMMVSDLKYFEEHILPERTGWSERACKETLATLTEVGLFRRERPSADNAIYYNRVAKTTYKYYPTHKYKAFLNKIENQLKDLQENIEEYKEKGVDPPNQLKKGGLDFSI